MAILFFPIHNFFICGAGLGFFFHKSIPQTFVFCLKHEVLKFYYLCYLMEFSDVLTAIDGK